MQNKQHPHTWVVVADTCQAKIYRLVKFPKIEKVFYLEHPESRLHNQDLISSKPGHSSQRGSYTGRSYESEKEPKQLEAAKFAVHLAHFLADAEKKGEFNRLYIIAGPTFLGLLRQHISPALQKMIVAEIGKDLTSSDIANIEHHLAEA